MSDTPVTVILLPDDPAALARALASVRTPYVMFHDAATAAVPAAVVAAARFLDRHPEYTACCVEARCVYRVSDATARIDALEGQWIHDGALLLHLLQMLTTINGRVKYLRRPSGRRAPAPGVSAFDRMLKDTWSGDFATFVGVAARALATRDGVSMEEAQRLVVKAYRADIAPVLLAQLTSEPTVGVTMSLTATVAQAFLRLSPDNWIRRFARTVYRRTPWISADAVHGTELRTRPVPDAGRDFAPVHSFLTQYHPPD